MENYNKLSAGEIERLAWLSEELGEVQQIIGKILRHGYESTWPPGQSPTNREFLHKELRDVMFVLQLMQRNNDIDIEKIEDGLQEKSYENCYLHHQESLDMDLPWLCENCGIRPATPPHPCPYAEEIHDDHDECTCCEECTQECSWDI